MENWLKKELDGFKLYPKHIVWEEVSQKINKSQSKTMVTGGFDFLKTATTLFFILLFFICHSPHKIEHQSIKVFNKNSKETTTTPFISQKDSLSNATITQP
jgi:hypothetical protein